MWVSSLLLSSKNEGVHDLSFATLLFYILDNQWSSLYIQYNFFTIWQLPDWKPSSSSWHCQWQRRWKRIPYSDTCDSNTNTSNSNTEMVHNL